MIEFRTLSDSHPDLAHPPLVRTALLTLHYAQERGAIGLTKTKANAYIFSADHAHRPLSFTSAPILLPILP